MLRPGKRASHLSNPLSDEKKGSRMDPSSGSSPIIPTPILIGIVGLCIFFGFASEHFERTRGRDPFTGRVLGNGLKLSLPKSASASSSSLSPKSALSPEEDESLEYRDNQRYHVIFSTDCSPYQHWQSYLVYYSAMMVRQPGHVTQIVSGCEPDEAVAMQKWFETSIQFMSKRFHLHFTPTFSQVKDQNGEIVGDYKFFNKPFGLKHFLEYFEMLEFHAADGTHGQEDDIVILIDPDMPLLRPITSDFSSPRDTLIGPRRKGHEISDRVKHGTPVAQAYGLGTQWETFDLEKIAGPDSPAKLVNKEDGFLYFPVGPPYIGTVRDMYQISLKWTEFVPRVHAEYPHLLAEMFAFCIAAAHLELRFQIVDSLMISNTNTGGEGWPLIDKIPPSETCEFAANPHHDKYALPSVVHLCQRYSVGDDWFFGKRKIPHDIYECETPLFIEPPKDLALLYNYKKPPNAKTKTDLPPRVINQEAFMVCYLTSLINKAATFYKSNACPAGHANLKKTRTVADLFKEHEAKH